MPTTNTTFDDVRKIVELSDSIMSLLPKSKFSRLTIHRTQIGDSAYYITSGMLEYLTPTEDGEILERIEVYSDGTFQRFSFQFDD